MTRTSLVPLLLPADPTVALEAATKQYVDNKAFAAGDIATEPVGTILAWAGAEAPSSQYLICDGSSQLRSTYPELFSVISTTFGPGSNPGTTFSLPNLSGKFALGVSGLHPLTGTGSSGGQESVVLTEAQMPSHEHRDTGGNNLTTSTGAHRHGNNTDWMSADHAHTGQTGGQSADHSHTTTVGTAGAVAAGGSGTVIDDSYHAQGSSGASVDHSHGFTTSGAQYGAHGNGNHYHNINSDGDHAHYIYTSGSDNAHENMPPFQTVTYIIKALRATTGDLGPGIEIRDENSLIFAGATKLDFVGGQVSATLNGAKVDITIPGAPSGALADQITTPANPPSGKNKLYFKPDNKLYMLDSTGVEKEVGTGAGGGSGAVANEPVGSITAWPTASAPAGYLPCDGASVSRATYSELFAVIGTTYGTGNVELLSANASSMETDVAPWGFNLAFGTYGDGVSKAQSSVRAVAGTKSLLATWGTHANGNWIITNATIAAGTTYRLSVWVYVPTGSPDVRITDTFNFSGAWNTVKDAWTELVYTWTSTGTNLNFGIHAKGPSTSGQQCWIDKASVTAVAGTAFNLPDLRDRAVVGTSGTKTVGTMGGSATHTLLLPEMPTHIHPLPMGASGAPSGGGDTPLRSSGGADGGFRIADARLFSSGTYGSTEVLANQPHNNMSPYTALNYIIKYTKQLAGTDTLDWGTLGNAPGNLLNLGPTLTQIPFPSGTSRVSGMTYRVGGGLTATKAGTYKISADVAIQAQGIINWTNLDLRHTAAAGGTTIYQAAGGPTTSTGQSNITSLDQIITMAADDYITFWMSTSSTQAYVDGRSHVTAHRLAGAGPPGPQGQPGNDTAEWIDLNLPANHVVSTGGSVVAITQVKGALGIATDGAGRMVITKAGPYRVEVSLTIIQAAGYVVIDIIHRRAGVIIGLREQVPYNSSGWDSATAIGNFETLVGDTFEVFAQSGAAGIQIEANRCQFIAHRLAGAGPKGDKGDPGAIADSGWIVPALQNGFANLDANNYTPFGIRKVGGIVYIRGMLGSGGTRTSGTVIFTLPVGYRIGGSVNWCTHSAVCAGANVVGNNRVNIYAVSGEVKVNAIEATTWFDFSGISFPADA